MRPGGWFLYRLVYAIGWRVIFVAAVACVLFLMAKGIFG